MDTQSLAKCDVSSNIKDSQDHISYADYLINDGLHNNRFELFLQPQFDLASGRVVGAESLIRYRKSCGAICPPYLFIERAEENGRILEIGQRVQSLAADILCKQPDVKNLLWHISINMSANELLTETAFDHLTQLIESLSLTPHNIHVEITETALIEDPKRVINQLDHIKRLGCEVWLDDFGTGFSSLSLLSQLDIDGLKIDKSFVDKIQQDDKAFTLCSAIIALAQRLGLAVVAEGIESEEQLLTLAQLGCDRGQGYLLGKPVPVTDFFKDWPISG